MGLQQLWNYRGRGGLEGTTEPLDLISVPGAAARPPLAITLHHCSWLSTSCTETEPALAGR